MSKHNINGVSDIIGIYKSRFLAIEVKTPKTINAKTKTKTTIAQDLFIKQIIRQGGIAMKVCSVDQVIEKLEDIND